MAGLQRREKMLKRSMVILMVVILLISFSAVVLAEENLAEKAKADIEINIYRGSGEILFVDATNAAEPNENAAEQARDHPKNPIVVAGN